MQYEKLVAPTITELFESKIQKAILSGELATGEKLPPERELAEKMGISKSAVHLGLKNLERAGFIRIEPRQAVYVANWEESGGLETLTALLRSNVLKLEPENIKSLITVRKSLEDDAMRVLAKCHNNADILKLRSLALEIRDGRLQNPPLSDMELAERAFKFTHYICFRSKNTFSSLILNAFKPFTLTLWAEWIKQIGPEQAYSYLDQTALALRDGDAETAIGIVYRYNADFLERIQQSI